MKGARGSLYPLVRIDACVEHRQCHVAHHARARQQVEGLKYDFDLLAPHLCQLPRLEVTHVSARYAVRARARCVQQSRRCS